MSLRLLEFWAYGLITLGACMVLILVSDCILLRDNILCSTRTYIVMNCVLPFFGGLKS